MSDINFSKLTWENLPARTTALSATDLNRIENGIADSVDGVNSNSHSIAELQTRISQMSGGVPPTASSTSGMNPEVSPIYVNTTDGNWYYYDGTAWTSGGTYGGAVTDTTLSISGAPADAKAVGDALGTALTRLEEDEADIAVKADKTETVIATIVEPYYLSHRYLQTDGSGLPTGTASGNWNLYKLDVSDCDAVKITTYRSSTGSAKFNMWSFLSSDFADVTSSSESVETVVGVGEIFLATANAIVRTVPVPTGAKTMYIVCLAAQVSGFEVIKYDYGRFDTLRDVPEIGAEVDTNTNGISELNDEIKDLDHPVGWSLFLYVLFLYV